MDLKTQIKNLAHEAGFHDVGFARLEEKSEGARRFQEWLNRGYQGEMNYLPKGSEKRERPDLVLDGARSVIVLAWDYGERSQESGVRNQKTEGENQEPKNSTFESPFISRYAWREDYHLILGDKLKGIEKKLEEAFPTARFKSYVDTGPVMEKYWASLTSVGWLGKHTNLIHPERGSYFFLASLLTDLNLDPDLPTNDHCGRCTACIDICPTRAIVAPYVLDARLCISYLTIELKGPIPRDLRPLLGNHVFGCDDCQEVCPWNREARLPEEFLRNVRVEELIDYLSLTPAQFKKRFAKSPILRAKRRGFLRNVCVALGNIKDISTIPALIHALQDEEPLIRGHSAWALGQFGDSQAEDALRNRRFLEEDGWVSEEIRGALGH